MLLPVGLLLLAVAAAATFAFWIYGRRELTVRGRRVLAGLRAAALALALLLLWNPRLPVDAAPTGARRWVLLDRSLSMDARGADGRSAWDDARDRARELGDGAASVTWGDTLALTDALPERPDAGASRLAPALERAAEAGAREVVVVTDGRLDDPVAAREAVARLGLDVRMERVGGDVRNGGVAALILPRTVDAGEPVDAEVLLFGAGADSADVEVREEGRLVASRRVALPGAGREARVALELPAPAAEGERRYQARVVVDGDGFPADDERAGWVRVAPDQGVLLLLSLSADWEPRFLLPVLERVTGLPTRGFVRVGPDRFLPMGGDADVGGAVGSAEVVRLARAAELVVAHGVGAGAPGWVGALLGDARRALVLPRDGDGASLAGVSAGAPLGGEWYVAGDPPPSALAGELAGLDVERLPPLTGLLPWDAGSGGGEAPLEAQLQGTGPREAALALVDGAGGRTAVTLASGWWRWAFRPGAPRDAYERLWAGVAGWLLADAALAQGPGLRPAERVSERGRPVRWLGPGLAGDTVTLRVLRGDTAVLDTALVVSSGSEATTPPLPPGSYAFTSTAGDGPAGEGRFEVEAWSGELRAPVLDSLGPDPAADASAPGNAPGAASRGRPVRTHPLPWLLLLGLLCAEWVGRRRKGLR